MPEGDAVWRTAHRLHAALAGHRLAGADLRVPQLATAGDTLAGQTTLEVVPRGKHLLHRLDGGVTLHSHLKMEGSWQVVRASRPPRSAGRHTVRALVWTGHVVAVGDSLGALDLVRTTDEHRLVGHLGPDLLDPGFDRAKALANLAADPRTIGEALLDQRNLAGLGTIWTSEPLHAVGINPWARARDLPAEQRIQLVDTARRLLVTSVRAGRMRELQVYGREGRPCHRCGTTLRNAPIGAQPQQRTLSYCRVCQGGPPR